MLSCKKDRDPEKTIPNFGDISYFAKASAAGLKKLNLRAIDSVNTNTVDVTWSSASVYVEKISFVGKSNSLLDTTIKVGKNLNIFSADALAGVIKLPAGSYKDVKVKMFCIKSNWPDLAFHFRGTFKNSNGGTDSVLVGSSLPFEANLSVTEIVIDPADNYRAIFNFDLTKVLTGISARQLESAGSYVLQVTAKEHIPYSKAAPQMNHFSTRLY